MNALTATPAASAPASLSTVASLTGAPSAAPTPGPAFSFLPERLAWTPVRVGFHALGHLSDGIRVGQRFGFSSGEMLDYVYEHTPRGRTPLGRLVDRAYLETPGWRGIRERRTTLVRTLAAIVLTRRSQGLSTRILDIAGGPGRYLQDVASALGPDGLAIECRDADPDALALGERLARERGIANLAYARHDALDPDALAAIRPRPGVVVVSGLYEIIRDDDAVRASLAGVGHLLQPGGLLLLTGQPRHPQLAMIRNVLHHRDGSPWDMRLRSTETLEGWCRDAGFTDPHTTTDSQSIFTVTVARRG